MATRKSFSISAAPVAFLPRAGLLPLPSPFLTGLLNKPVVFHVKSRLEIIGVRCFPWTVFELLGLPAGRDGVRIMEHPIAQLQPALAEYMQAGRLVEALAQVEQYFLTAHARMADGRLLGKAGAAMREANGTLPVSQVAAAAHATVRTLERKFKQAAGYTVKDVSSLMRFEQVRNHLWRETSGQSGWLGAGAGLYRSGPPEPGIQALQRYDARSLRAKSSARATGDKPRFCRVCTSLTPEQFGILCGNH